MTGGSITRSITWLWHGQPIELGITEVGSGPPLLLLPALSSISTRHEMGPLLERLAAHYRAIAVDLPGFGDRPRPALDWSPETYRSFLPYLLGKIVPEPFAVIAAGHTATYALAQAVAAPNSIKHLVLIAPTWRGPLPTVMGGARPWFARARQLVDLPVLGPLAYKLNVNAFVVRKMTSGHVYSDKAWLTAERLREKQAVIDALGARFASVRFVTGALDPLQSRDKFVNLSQRAACAVPLVYGAETPQRSKAEMDVLSQNGRTQTVRLPRGKLAIHEEFPDEVAAAVASFLEAVTDQRH